MAWDDRTVESTLLSLKSMGLVRFVHPSHGGRTIRYRHVADERWRLSKGELAVLAVLVLRGPQTTGEVRAADGADDRPRRRHRRGDPRHASPPAAPSRSPSASPGAAGPASRGGRRHCRARRMDGIGWHRRPDFDDELDDTGSTPAPPAPPLPDQDLVRDVAELWLRVERLERLLGLSEDLGSTAERPGDLGAIRANRIWARSVTTVVTERAQIEGPHSAGGSSFGSKSSDRLFMQ